MGFLVPEWIRTTGMLHSSVASRIICVPIRASTIDMIQLAIKTKIVYLFFFETKGEAKDLPHLIN
jgi:hypothetical protein